MKTNTSRRIFLTTLGLGGAAVAAAVVGRQNTQSDAARKAEDRRGARGYRITEHVKNYYRTARV